MVTVYFPSYGFRHPPSEGEVRGKPRRRLSALGGHESARRALRHDAGMRIPKAVRWLGWALWWGCLAFSLWFLWALYVLYTSGP